MIASLSLLLAGAAFSIAKPLEVRTVAALNTAAFEEAQQIDTTATKAFSKTSIKTSSGQCLFVDELSGDFRANLTPIQIGACDGSQGQQWDVITKGKHVTQAGTMLLVNDLTNACMNFDPRRAAGNTVIMFSCGGRADGGGDATNSQEFTFNGGSGPLAFAPTNQAGTCLTVTSKNVLDSAACNNGDANQQFTFGGAASNNAASAPAKASVAKTTAAAAADETTSASQAAETAAAAVATSAGADSASSCGGTTFITVTRDSTAAASSSADAQETTQEAATAAAEASTAAITAAPAVSSAAAGSSDNFNGGKIPQSNPTTPVPVSGAGGTLQPSSVAEAQKRDDSATRAFTGASLKSSSGQCLFIDPTAGDFRENLIPVSVKTCDGSPNEKFDLITKGAHNNADGFTLIVSSITNGCLSFDPRRAAGTTVQMFSCGGRGDGSGQVSNSQLFPYTGGNTILITPQNNLNQVCLQPKNGILDNGSCDGNADQLFTIVP